MSQAFQLDSLSYPLAAIKAWEEATGESFLAFLNDFEKKATYQRCVTLIWAGLLKANRNATVEDVEAWLEAEKLYAVAVAKALEKALEALTPAIVYQPDAGAEEKKSR